MQARPAEAEARSHGRIFQTRDAPPPRDEDQVPIAPQTSQRRRPGLY